jgi:hypothetical protein
MACVNAKLEQGAEPSTGILAFILDNRLASSPDEEDDDEDDDADEELSF